MRDTTRRRICRIAFLALCIGPTVAIGSWASYWQTSQFADRQARQWQQRIGQFTGLRAVVGKAWSPTPNSIVLERVELWEPAGDEPLVKASTVEIYLRDDVWVLEASYPEIAVDGLGPLLRRFNQRLLRDASDPTAARLLTPELTLRTLDGDASLANVSLSFRSRGERGAECELRFGMAGEDHDEPVRLVAQRRRNGEHWATLGELSTGGASLPWSTIRSFAADWIDLGEAAEFQGDVEWAAWEATGEDTWRVSKGELYNLELDRLVTDFFPYKMSGDIRIGNIQAQAVNGALEFFSGELHSSSAGVASRRLVESLEKHAGLHAALPPAADDGSTNRLLRYSQLGVAFEIRSNGFATLTPLCAGPLQGAIMLDGEQAPLILAADSRETPVASLVKGFTGDNRLTVSATTASAKLLSKLPLPSGRERAGSLRLRDE
ncbi:MAG: hypothetical protein QGG36_07600 [Pirellulaceae bacterium]|jgi:hypothetical protein|nr:hypothetical protein [Pirellulaceae bacterium]MDP7015648.1 hypothetical protein [Pirellulaceae bacterium]